MTRTKPVNIGATQELVPLPALRVSELDRKVLVALSQRGALSFDELAASLDGEADVAGRVRHLVAEGLVYVQAIEYLWGIELQLGLTEVGRTTSGLGPGTEPKLPVRQGMPMKGQVPPRGGKIW
jgi:hypothetical protein